MPASRSNLETSRAPNRATAAGSKSRNAARKFSRLRRIVSQLSPDMKPSSTIFSNRRLSSAMGRPHSVSWYRRYRSSESPHQHRATPSGPTLMPDGGKKTPRPVGLDQRFELCLEVALHVRPIADGPLRRLAVLEDDT